MNKISIIGVGKLGLCLALNLANKGFKIICYDINEDYINKLKKKEVESEEPFVNELLKQVNLGFANNLWEALNFSDIIFVLVDTPSLDNNRYDHSRVNSVLDNIEKIGYQEHRKMLVIGCTTFPGYCESLVSRMSKCNIDILYNPEFISQGNILYEQKNPDIVLIGESNKNAGDVLEKVYDVFCENKPQIFRMGLTEAELSKLSINCFITTKISFANMIGDLCSKMEIDSKIVLKSIGADTRIGNKSLNWGFGFGGPCFPRDNKALVELSKDYNLHPSIALASDEYNDLHLKYYADFLKKYSVENKIILDGITYKKNTNIIVESQQLKTALELYRQGYKVTIIDTENVINKVKDIYGDIFVYEIKK